MSDNKFESIASTDNKNDSSVKQDENTLLSPVEESEIDRQEVHEQSQKEPSVNTQDQSNDSSNSITLNSPIKRSVTFPGDGLVSGYLDPPDPWKNALKWTSADLIDSYKSSCKKHNTKPINSLVNQLQGIENVGERYAILSLKGEKLDMKNVETLEEIFKFVQFQCVDLEGTHLDEETSVAIFEMIEYYESACKVNISFNKNISIRGWQSCARMLRKTPGLTFLDARNCDINEKLLPILGRALRMGCFLKILHLENTYMSGRPLVILVAALKMNETLKELFLADNKLMPTDGIQIGNLLKYNHVLELIDLRNNHLQDIGIGHICDGLYEQNLSQGLNTLVLWNNQLSYQGMSAVSKALALTKSLETINIGHNNITNEGIHLLKEGLLQNKSLLRLGLQGTKVTCEGAVALAEVIADSPRLVRVDLRENEIKTAGLMALSLALKVNDIIHRLDLDKEMKKETGIKDYADQQKRLHQDINRKLEENRDVFFKQEQGKTETTIKTVEKKEDNKPSGDDVSFIESVYKVKRPMLLHMPDTTPQMLLDSPHCIEESADYIPFPKSNSVITTPPSEIILSPQYCTSVGARKLFTVSKVSKSPLSPTNSSLPVILSPTVELSSILPNTLPVLPLQPVLINPSADIPNKNNVDKANGDGNSMTSIPKIAPLTVSDLTNTLVDESVNHILNQIICDEPSEKKSIAIPNSVQDNDTVLETSDTIIQRGDSMLTSSDTNMQGCDTVLEGSETNIQRNDRLLEAADRYIQESHTVLEACDRSIHGNVVLGISASDTDNLKHDIVLNDNDKNCDKTKVEKSTNVQSNNDKCSDSDFLNSNNNHLQNFSLTNGCDLDFGHIEQTNVNENDPGVVSHDCEQWTSVGDSIKPNFQTSLTLNGLTQELASAIEGLDVSPEKLTEAVQDDKNESAGNVSSTDDFEKELDEMLANVRSGSNLLSGMNKTEVLQDSPLQ